MCRCCSRLKWYGAQCVRSFSSLSLLQQIRAMLKSANLFRETERRTADDVLQIQIEGANLTDGLLPRHGHDDVDEYLLFTFVSSK